jgi:hypothetical protein
LDCGDKDQDCGDRETDETNETIGAKQTIRPAARDVG